MPKAGGSLFCSVYSLVRPLLFSLDAETAHELTLGLLKTIQKRPLALKLIKSIYRPGQWNEPVEVAGLRFPNRVGLAAGLDKNALVPDVWAALGFGFAEFGTVTPLPQPGNPRPRLFRLPQDQALINRMGFNNRGADVAAERLRQRRSRDMIIGANVGKNKDTPPQRAAQDYGRGVRALADVADYFTVNVSSPNTPGLRSLQQRDALVEILKTVLDTLQELGMPKPVFVKLAPDLTDTAVDEVTDVCMELGCAGLVATNTTLDRSGLRTPADLLARIGEGGLSGAPLHARSTAIVERIRRRADRRLAIIASGGILTPRHAIDKIRAGADLVQLYTGLIYQGPALIAAVKKALRDAA